MLVNVYITKEFRQGWEAVKTISLDAVPDFIIIWRMVLNKLSNNSGPQIPLCKMEGNSYRAVIDVDYMEQYMRRNDRSSWSLAEADRWQMER